MNSAQTVLLFFAINTSMVSSVLAAPVLPILPAGTQYRVAFVTSDSIDATSSDIQDYHDFVAAQAASEPILAALNTDWYAIAATEAAPMARTNSMTSGTGVPIYLLDGGARLVDDYDDLWDGSLDRPLEVFQTGLLVPFAFVWTGTNASGVSTLGEGLGTSSPIVGGNFSSTALWADASRFSQSNQSSVYAISGTLTAVPEPSAFLCLGLVGIGFVGSRRVLNSRK